MPDIDSLLEKTKKKFKKSDYRPWNYLDQIEKEEADESVKSDSTNHKIDNTIQTNHTKNEIHSGELAQAQKFNSSDSDEKKPLKVLDDYPNDKKNMSIKVDAGVNNRYSTLSDQKTADQQIRQQPNKRNEKLSATEINPDKKYLLWLLLNLSGHQKKVFDFICEKCLARKELFTGNITIDELKLLGDSSAQMIKLSVARLADKQLIMRERGKAGRGGYYRFSVPQEVMDMANEEKATRLLLEQESNENESESEETSIACISDNDGQLPISRVLPEEWKEIDFEPLREIGFNSSHLIQLYKEGNVTVESMKESIEHFAFDLKNNNKKIDIKAKPINYFMGILKRLGYYNPPENYVSSRDLLLSERLEKKKKEKEERDNKVKELINCYFDDWHISLSEEDKQTIIPDNIRLGRLTAAKIASLRTYFIEHVWPNMPESKNII